MAYAIIRLSKLKGGSVEASGAHVYRERETPNANPDPDRPNVYIGAKSTSQLRAAINARIATATNKVRSTAVEVIEFLVSASPKFFEDADDETRKKYFAQAYRFFESRFGAENLVSFAAHYDELTPHASVYVVPIDPAGKLNAKHFFGTRAKLSQLQTDFADCVANLGLERGVKGSNASHKKVKTYYAEVNKQAAEAALRAIPLEVVLRHTGCAQSHKDADTWLTPAGSISISRQGDKTSYRLDDGKLKKTAIDLVMDLHQDCTYGDALRWLRKLVGHDRVVHDAKTRAEDKALAILETDLEHDLVLKTKAPTVIARQPNIDARSLSLNSHLPTTTPKRKAQNAPDLS